MRNLKIKSKLIISFGIVILLALLLGAFAAQRANLVGRHYRAFIDTHFHIDASSQAAVEYAEIIDFGIDIVYWIIAFGVLLVVAATIMATYIIRSITRPIDKLKKSSHTVAQGNFSVVMRTNDTDELGELSNAIADMVDAVKNIANDLTDVRDIYGIQGQMNFRVNANKYQNSFREIAESVNHIMDSEVGNIKDVANTLNQISDGNFDIQITEMQGDFTFQSQAIRAVIDNLKAVSTEVNAMIEAFAVNGDLNFKTNADKFKGDWRKIMIGLNDVVEGTAIPLSVIRTSLDVMKSGIFDLAELDRQLAATGLNPDVESYSGVFKEIMDTIEATMNEIYSYINEVEEVLEQTANGDLRQKIDRPYIGQFTSIKDSINNITSTLHKTMSEISTAAEQVLSGASQISNSASGLASGAQEQASSIEELNAAIEVLNQQTRQNADNALNANKLSSTSATNAQEGNEAMNQTLGAMLQIKESSGNISKIIKTIQDIAFQTNLLALNASVEAARAGEHGRGFAVVADEVRNLAGKSQDAANETTELIQDSISRVEIGASIAEKTSDSLNAIVTSAGEVSEIIDNISTASQGQAEAIAQVSDGLAQISKVTQSNSAVSEETAAAAEELNSQADLLRQLVSYFKL